MDARGEIRDFLTSRRARLKPEDVHLSTSGFRRVPGLRREEVATLAGLSVDYYNRMERGNLSGVSESVLDALARALRLDEAERAHLFDLARAYQPRSRRRRRATKQKVRPSVQWMLDSMTGAAAIAENGRLDALATNRLGRALIQPSSTVPAVPSTSRTSSSSTRARRSSTTTGSGRPGRAPRCFA
jgi:transcriptional regulator with XRE-family HTH domain